MTSVSDFLLTNITAYGAPLFAAVLLLGQFGFPIPTTFLVVAVGAFCQQGILDWGLATALGLAGAVIGDIMSFGIGYFARNWVQRKFGGKQIWQQAQGTFDKRGGLAIYLTRFILTAIAFPINLIAGGSGFRFPRYTLYSLAGNSTWILIYGGLGYLFGSQWELINDVLSDFGGLALGLAILGAGIFWAIRRYARKPADVEAVAAN